MTIEFQPRPDLFEARPRPTLPEEEVAAMLAPFDESGRELMGYSFGLDRGGMLRTSFDVAEHFGMTRDEVRIAQARAMANREAPENPSLGADFLRKLFMHAVEPDALDN